MERRPVLLDTETTRTEVRPTLSLSIRLLTRGKVGASNADHPNYRPTLYDPAAPYGARFSTNFPSSQFERLYHSSASLLADGRIIISGGNPNGDMSTQPYRTHYEVEIFSRSSPSSLFNSR